jgi:alcohol dehydrogenase
MQAVVYHGPGDRRLENVPDPRIEDPNDVIVRVSTSTICGTDLHILRGDVPTIRPGTVLGHEGVGVVEEAGAAVRRVRKGDRVIVPALSTCGVCKSCKRQMAFFCENGGGWQVGHLANGMQAQYARVPLADTSLHVVPEGLEDVDVLFLTDSIPTGYECGIETGRLRPGETLAVVGAGPVGLSAVVTSRLHGPRLVISIDPDDNRLEVAQQLGADHVINPSRQDAREEILRLSDGGVDLAVEAVGVPETFDLCVALIRGGGRVASLGVHGHPTTLHLEELWSKNVTITTQTLDGHSIPMLLDLIRRGKLQPRALATHAFTLERAMEAYDVFGAAATNKAIKVTMAA